MHLTWWKSNASLDFHQGLLLHTIIPISLSHCIFLYLTKENIMTYGHLWIVLAVLEFIFLDSGQFSQFRHLRIILNFHISNVLQFLMPYICLNLNVLYNLGNRFIYLISINMQGDANQGNFRILLMKFEGWRRMSRVDDHSAYPLLEAAQWDLYLACDLQHKRKLGQQLTHKGKFNILMY